VADRPRDAENASEALILPRDAGIKRFLSRHAVSVCISDTFVDSVKTNKHIFKIFSPSGSQAILHCEPKNAPFYFCNNFVKTYCILIIFGAQILK